jgi:hypothetical protein
MDRIQNIDCFYQLSDCSAWREPERPRGRDEFVDGVRLGVAYSQSQAAGDLL